MNISKVHVELTGEDILSIINEFLKIDGLDISKVAISQEIEITGCYTNKISIDFKISVSSLQIKEGKLFGRINKINVKKLGIFRPFRSLIIKYAIKLLALNGITRQKDAFIIDIDKLLFDIPYIELELEDIFIKNNILNVDVEKINISLMGNIIKKEEVLVEEEAEEKVIEVHKIEDNYSKGREAVKKKIMPKSKSDLAEYVFIVPDVIALINRLLRDKRVSLKTKIIIGATIAYVSTPNNIIPNKIPFIGKIDDLSVVFFAVNTMVNDVELNVLLENWQGKDDFIFLLKNSLDYIINYTGAANVQKLCSVIEELTTL